MNGQVRLLVPRRPQPPSRSTVAGSAPMVEPRSHWDDNPQMSPTPEPAPMDRKIKHLEFIQGVINRLASDSFRMKGWSVVLVSARRIANSAE